MKRWGVLFTGRDGAETRHALYATEDEAIRAGAALAREVWAEYTSEPFPEDDGGSDDGLFGEMDALRTAFPVHLEVEPVEVPQQWLCDGRDLALIEAAVAHLVGLSQGVEDTLRHDLAFEQVYGTPDKADGIKQDLGEQSVTTADWVRLLAKVRGK